MSAFLHWKEAHGEDTTGLIAGVVNVLARHGYPTQVIAAAVRNARQIGEAALAGSHCLTTSADVYRESFNNPFTDMGNRLFGEAWGATPKG